MGGEAALKKVVDDAFAKSAANPYIGHFFDDMSMSMQHLKKSTLDFVCMHTGGPHKYKGEDMATAHKGLHLSERDFDIFMQDIVEAMQENGVGQAEIEEAGAILESTRQDVIGK